MRMADTEYPRPQFRRSSWESLNGSWDFAFDDKDLGLWEKWYERFPIDKKIIVPFTYETKASGIGEEAFHPVVWYHKKTELRAEDGKRTLLHFESSDWQTDVWVNGQHAGDHKGGYTRFSFDISHLLRDGENSIAVRVQDSNDLQQPRGKQRWQKNNFACWYVQTTGIWKTVWLEQVGAERLETVKMTPSLENFTLNVEWKVAAKTYGGDLMLAACVSYDGKEVICATTQVTAQRGSMRLDVADYSVDDWGLKTWTPEQPNLYDITFTLIRGGKIVDEVESYFGMREISIQGSQILLNGEPYYQKLLLDQGYWENSHLTPPDDEALKLDVQLTKEMGFNGARKHQKVEDERFYYWCDVLGLLVWSEMPSPYVFGDDMVVNFMEEWQQVVRMHYNHPSVITWTPVNESWGVQKILTNKKQQNFTEAIYHLTKSLDNTRPVIVNDGWEHTVSDIITLHDYEEKAEVLYRRYMCNREEILANQTSHNRAKMAFANGYEYKGQPVIISEYGGAAYSDKAQGAWGYGNGVQNEQALLKRIDEVTTAIRRLPYVCGYCYTQTTDVQQEVNGLLDMRRNSKVDKNAIFEINTRKVEPDYYGEDL